MSSRLFILDPIYQSPVGVGGVKVCRGKTRERKGQSKENMSASSWWLLCSLCVQLKDYSVIYLHPMLPIDSSLLWRARDASYCFISQSINYVTEIMLCNSHTHRNKFSCLDGYTPTHPHVCTCTYACAHTYTQTHTLFCFRAPFSFM